ncbi:hypothetical protein [Mycobacterium sp. MUNTM1]
MLSDRDGEQAARISSAKFSVDPWLAARVAVNHVSARTDAPATS